MKIKLFMLPFSGGGYYSYNDFLKYVPSWLEPVRVELPGHGKRMLEPLLTDIHKLTPEYCFRDEYWTVSSFCNYLFLLIPDF